MIGLACVGLLAAAFIAATEAALLGLRPDHREQLARGPLGTWLSRRLDPPEDLVATLALGSQASKVGVAAISAALLASTLPGRLWLNLVVLTPVLVLLCEIAPKVLGFRAPLAWLRVATGPLILLTAALLPARWVLLGLVRLLATALGADVGAVTRGLAEDELRMLVDRGAAAGQVDPLERELIEAVFDFDEITVERLMTPRPDLFAVPLTLPWPELVRQAHAAGFSRIPVYGERTDDILGVLLLKDLLKHRRVPPAGPRQLRSLLLPPIFVPGSRSADAMLGEFLERKLHMAFVVDEHGALIGLITLEDLLAELMAELDGPTDEAEIARLSPEHLTVKASVDLEDFAEQTGIALPDGDGSYHTVGGFVFHELGRLPRPGDTVLHEGHAFTVLAMEGRRIADVAVRMRKHCQIGKEAAG